MCGVVCGRCVGGCGRCQLLSRPASLPSSPPSSLLPRREVERGRSCESIGATMANRPSSRVRFPGRILSDEGRRDRSRPTVGPRSVLVPRLRLGTGGREALPPESRARREHGFRTAEPCGRAFPGRAWERVVTVDLSWALAIARQNLRRRESRRRGRGSHGLPAQAGRCRVAASRLVGAVDRYGRVGP